MLFSLISSASDTWILKGLLTSKLADALNEKLAKGLENVVEFKIVKLLVLIAWVILFTFKKGVLPVARSGNSSEDAVYLIYSDENR